VIFLFCYSEAGVEDEQKNSEVRVRSLLVSL